MHNNNYYDQEKQFNSIASCIIIARIIGILFCIQLTSFIFRPCMPYKLWASSLSCLSISLDPHLISLIIIVPVEAVILNVNHTLDSKIVPNDGVNIRYVTLNMEPVLADRTDVNGFSITNSQNDEVLRVGLTPSSVTIALAPGTVTFNITTLFDCPSLPFQYYVVEVPCKYVRNK